MDVSFRRATGRDGEAALQVVDRALRDYGMNALPETSDRDLADIEQHYDARGGCFELVELGSEVVGVLGWRPAGDGVFELSRSRRCPRSTIWRTGSSSAATGRRADQPAAAENTPAATRASAHSQSRLNHARRRSARPSLW